MGYVIDLAAARRRLAARERRRKANESGRAARERDQAGTRDETNGDGRNRDPERTPNG